MFGEYVDGVFVPMSEMDIEEHPEGIVQVSGSSKVKVNFTKRAENVYASNLNTVAYILDYNGTYYNGIQSIDLTRIYDESYHEEPTSELNRIPVDIGNLPGL